VVVRRPSVAEVATAAAIVATGAWLRWWHLGTPSLWWDELVHVATAQQGSVTAVLQAARLGVAPGAGNAGAVPLDYLLLHGFLATVPAPAAEHFERWVRAPACLWSAMTPLVLWLWARTYVGRAAALLAALLLALSVPHVLYAAEARFYALFGLATVAQLWTFSHLLARRTGASWALFAAGIVLYFLTGLLGVLVVAVEFAVLLALALREGRSRGALLGLGGSATLLLVVMAAYLAEVDPHGHMRERPPALDPWGISWRTLGWFTEGSAVLRWAAVAAPVVLLARARWLGRPCLPTAIVLAAALLAVVPAIVLVEQWRQYYFHPRHALFILPVLMLGIAVVLETGLRRLDPLRRVLRSPARRRAVYAAVLLGAVAALQGPTAWRFVQHPEAFFARTKSGHDVAALVRDLQVAAGTLHGRQKILVLVERFGPGRLANPVLARYLWLHGLHPRVVLRSTGNVGWTLGRVAELCAAGCPGMPGPDVERAVGTVGPPLSIGLAKRLLLHLPPSVGRWPGRVRHVVVVTYSPVPVGPWTRRLERRRHGRMLAWWSPRAEP